MVTNYLATANLVTCCEALMVSKQAGMDLNVAFEALRISSGNSFVHETESQVILNGSRDINFTMDLVRKDIGLFQAVADRANVPLEISPLLIDIFDDGIARYGERELVAQHREASGGSRRHGPSGPRISRPRSSMMNRRSPATRSRFSAPDRPPAC